jgi:hypothetical protein
VNEWPDCSEADWTSRRESRASTTSPVKPASTLPDQAKSSSAGVSTSHTMEKDVPSSSRLSAEADPLSVPRERGQTAPSPKAKDSTGINDSNEDKTGRQHRREHDETLHDDDDEEDGEDWIDEDEEGYLEFGYEDLDDYDNYDHDYEGYDSMDSSYDSDYVTASDDPQDTLIGYRLWFYHLDLRPGNTEQTKDDLRSHPLAHHAVIDIETGRLRVDAPKLSIGPDGKVLFGCWLMGALHTPSLLAYDWQSGEILGVSCFAHLS